MSRDNIQSYLGLTSVGVFIVSIYALFFAVLPWFFGLQIEAAPVGTIVIVTSSTSTSSTTTSSATSTSSTTSSTTSSVTSSSTTTSSTTATSSSASTTSSSTSSASTASEDAVSYPTSYPDSYPVDGVTSSSSSTNSSGSTETGSTTSTGQSESVTSGSVSVDEESPLEGDFLGSFIRGEYFLPVVICCSLLSFGFIVLLVLLLSKYRQEKDSAEIF